MRSFAGLTLFMSVLLAGCVGTVQDATQSFSKINEAPKSSLSFAGISSATAISDSRIEVFFFPAIGGSGKYIYDVMIGNAPFPISTPSEVVKPDFRGLLKITLTGLSRLTTYQIKVEARDKESPVQSTSGIIKNVTTFDNLVSDFHGISSAFNTPGQDGKDSLKVRWTPAAVSGSLSKKEYDPKTYEIVLVDSERLTPLDMDLPLTPGDGKWVFSLNHDDSVNEYIVRGLPSKTLFYIRMRAIHEGSVEDVYDPRKRGERNTNYITISTLSDDLADIDFKGDSLAVSLAPGEQGLHSIYGTWGRATGVFDHFRLYYSELGGGVGSLILPDLCLTPLVSDPLATVFCKRATYDADNAPITGLKPYTLYEVVLVLCATTQCPVDKRIISPVRTITTDPSFPAFNGIKEDIKSATSLADIGTLKIKFDPPNFTAGYFDGLILRMRRTNLDDGSDIEITEVTTPVYHDNYNFLATYEVVVNGIDYLSNDPYCFTLFPFKWDVDGITKRESPNGVWRCVQPRPIAPTELQFLGFAEASTQEDIVTLTWVEPLVGVFSHYEIFWSKPHVGTFIWGDAISDAGDLFDYTDYGRKLVPSGSTNLVMNGFANGSYKFGIITYYTYVTDSGNVVLRSETNEGVLSCTFDSTNPNPVNCI
ncbi:MAG TPA: hypothetical protein VNJ08_02185 [Bacteriovoracaceae bacterium]|nr:hypothetical protein [Bacteriovoracaceae bacterium]